MKKAKELGYRSRAAFKFLEIQEKFKIIKKDNVVVDLGAAPGGWSQIASRFAKKVVAIDLLQMEALPNVEFIQGDFLEEEGLAQIKEKLNFEFADAIISDMAPSTCGIPKIDHIRIMNLVEEVFEFCKSNLKPGGNMVAKVFQGGAEQSLLTELKKSFSKIAHFKPNSSRKESPEMYLIALGFRG